jgi:hypothetical protein
MVTRRMLWSIAVSCLIRGLVWAFVFTLLYTVLTHPTHPWWMK